jgi:hypothetical protein
MDIPVSRLNERLAVQLPAELPLGLVFVVGQVNELSLPTDGRGLARSFHLVDGEHHLPCQASDRALEALELSDGDRVRAGGHLAFDPRTAAYYLLARDVEVLPEQPAASSALAAIIADIDSRAEAANLAPAELPEWVKRMAPSGLALDRGRPSEELGELSEPSAAGREAEERQATSEVGARTVEADETAHGEAPGAEDRPLQYEQQAEMVHFLSEAMDSSEEVELTPELLARFDPTAHLDEPTPPDAAAIAPDDLADQPVQAADTPVSVEAVSDEAESGEVAAKSPSTEPSGQGWPQWFEKLPWYVVVLAVMLFFGLLAGLFILGLLFNVIPIPG